jgi:hypothetical protein
MCLSAVPTYFALSFVDLTTGTRLGCQLEPCNNARLTCECRRIDRSRPAGQLIFRGSNRLLTMISFPINS